MQIKAYLFLLFIMVAGCRKKKQSEDLFITLRYSQTFYADAWQTGSSDTASQDNLTANLKGQNINVAVTTIKKDAAEEYVWLVLVRLVKLFMSAG